MILKISFCILALAVNLAASSEYSGLISRLYKKATDENRPLVLVLDNSDKGSLKDSLQVYNEPRSKPSHSDRTINSQIQLLDLLSKKLNPVTKEPKVPVPEYDHPITDHKHSDLHRLQERLEREIRERRDRRLKKQAEKQSYQPRADSYVNKLYSNDDIYDKKRVTFQVDNKEKGLQDKNQYREEKKALRSSVIKSLLRTYNDLNCEAKDECLDECGGGKKNSGCEDKCENKFQCDAGMKQESGGGGGGGGGCNEGNDTCEQDDDNPSTRGVLYEPEPTEKCKRC